VITILIRSAAAWRYWLAWDTEMQFLGLYFALHIIDLFSLFANTWDLNRRLGQAAPEVLNQVVIQYRYSAESAPMNPILELNLEFRVVSMPTLACAIGWTRS